MKTLGLILIIFYAVIIVYTLYLCRKSVITYKERTLNCPVFYRLGDNNIFQYSVDGETWDDVMGFTSKAEYKDKDGKTYIGPGFGPIIAQDEGQFEVLKNALPSLQSIHKWNTAAFKLYKVAINEYLENEKEDVETTTEG